LLPPLVFLRWSIRADEDYPPPVGEWRVRRDSGLPLSERPGFTALEGDPVELRDLPFLAVREEVERSPVGSELRPSIVRRSAREAAGGVGHVRLGEPHRVSGMLLRLADGRGDERHEPPVSGDCDVARIEPVDEQFGSQLVHRESIRDCLQN